MLADHRGDGSLPVAPAGAQGGVGNLGRGVEPPLAVDPDVQDVLDDAHGLVAHQPGILGSLARAVQRAADVLDDVDGLFVVSGS